MKIRERSDICDIFDRLFDGSFVLLLEPHSYQVFN